MDSEMITTLVTGLTFAVGAAAPAIAMGMIAKAGLESIGRNPETENAVRTTMILGLAFVESIAVFALLVTLIVKFV